MVEHVLPLLRFRLVVVNRHPHPPLFGAVLDRLGEQAVIDWSRAVVDAAGGSFVMRYTAVVITAARVAL